MNRVVEMIERFKQEHADIGYGILPGYEFEHIVISDYNLSDEHILFCLDTGRIEAWLVEYRETSEDEKQTRQKYCNDAVDLLRRLLAVPEEERLTAETYSSWNL